MEKRLSKSGNGLVLYIDKALQKLLQIEDGSIVKVETDGIRIMVEPLRPGGTRASPRKLLLEPWLHPGFVRDDEDAAEARSRYYAKSVFRELERSGLTDELFLRVEEFSFLENWERRHRASLKNLYWEYLCHRKGPPMTRRKDYETLRRLEHLLQARAGGLGWDAAIEAALVAVPREPNAIEATAHLSSERRATS